MRRNNKWVEDVEEWQIKFERTPVPRCKKDLIKLLRLRADLIHEENGELMRGVDNLINAIREGEFDSEARKAAKVETLDAIVDSIYVLIGMANVMGWDIEGAFDEVHSSNLSKAGPDGLPLYNAAGKVMKGPNFRHPNLEPFVD